VWSTIPATCTSAWVSTPPVTGRPASAIVGMSSPFLAGTEMAPRGTGRADRALLGQQRSGSYQVTAVPAPRGSTSSRRTPAGGSGTRHAHAVSYVQSQAGARRQNAPSLTEPVADRRETHRKGPIRNLTHTILRKCHVPDRFPPERPVDALALGCSSCRASWLRVS